MSSDYDAARARLTACYTCFRNKMKEMKDFDSVSFQKWCEVCRSCGTTDNTEDNSRRV